MPVLDGGALQVCLLVSQKALYVKSPVIWLLTTNLVSDFFEKFGIVTLASGL